MFRKFILDVSVVDLLCSIFLSNPLILFVLLKFVSFNIVILVQKYHNYNFKMLQKISVNVT